MRIGGNEKFQKFVGFTKTRFLKEGISQAWKSINSLDDSSMYNPLKYLNEAKEKDIDLKAFFPK